MHRAAAPQSMQRQRNAAGKALTDRNDLHPCTEEKSDQTGEISYEGESGMHPILPTIK